VALGNGFGYLVAFEYLVGDRQEHGYCNQHRQRPVGRVVLADCEQGWRGHDGSGCVDHEYAADIVREVYTDGEFSSSVHQRDHGPQQTWNEEVGEEYREPTARDRLRVSEVRQGKYHGWHDRQKHAVRPDQARALHDVSAKEKFFSDLALKKWTV
jgi:hypothetical protein